MSFWAARRREFNGLGRSHLKPKKHQLYKKKSSRDNSCFTFILKLYFSFNSEIKVNQIKLTENITKKTEVELFILSFAYSRRHRLWSERSFNWNFKKIQEICIEIIKLFIFDFLSKLLIFVAKDFQNDKTFGFTLWRNFF